MTLIAQVRPGFTVVQLFVSEKSPLVATLETLNAALPVFLTVTVFALLVFPTLRVAKLRLVGVRVTAGAVVEDVPVPVRLTVCGLPLALSVMVIEPVRVPVAVGVNVTLIVQGVLAARELGHELEAKSPLITMLEMESVAVPVFVSVTVCDALVVFSNWLPKIRPVGDRVTAGLFGAVPTPVKLTVCGLPPALSVILIEPLRVPVAVGVNVTFMVQLALMPRELGHDVAA